MPKPIIEVSINRDKISKDLLYKGKKGTYLNLAFFENQDGNDQYENDGYCVQRTTKEQREAGVKPEICGNWKYIEQDARPKSGQSTARPAKPPVDPDLDADGDDAPFNAVA